MLHFRLVAPRARSGSAGTFQVEGSSSDFEAVLQDVPVADAKPEEIKELLGGALFKALYKWMIDSGPVYLLPTGGALQALLPIVPSAGCMNQLEENLMPRVGASAR